MKLLPVLSLVLFGSCALLAQDDSSANQSPSGSGDSTNVVSIVDLAGNNTSNSGTVFNAGTITIGDIPSGTVISAGTITVSPSIAPAAPNLFMSMVKVDDAGNDADPKTGYGAVANSFSIARHDVTADQYCAFLNAVATNGDPYGLYDPRMGTDENVKCITRTIKKGVSTYFVIQDDKNRGQFPITYVSLYSAARFCNWLQNGFPSTDPLHQSTETGAYALNKTTGPLERTEGAVYFIPNEDELYKSIYYKGGGLHEDYYPYPNRSMRYPANTIGQANDEANCRNSFGYGSRSEAPYVTPVGLFSTSLSAYGANDTGGNVDQWTTQPDKADSTDYVIRGGSWASTYTYDWLFATNDLQKESRRSVNATTQCNTLGFRVASSSDSAVLASATTEAPADGQWSTTEIAGVVGLVTLGGAYGAKKCYDKRSARALERDSSTDDNRNMGEMKEEKAPLAQKTVTELFAKDADHAAGLAELEHRRNEHISNLLKKEVKEVITVASGDSSGNDSVTTVQGDVNNTEASSLMAISSTEIKPSSHMKFVQFNEETLEALKQLALQSSLSTEDHQHAAVIHISDHSENIGEVKGSSSSSSSAIGTTPLSSGVNLPPQTKLTEAIERFEADKRILDQGEEHAKVRFSNPQSSASRWTALTSYLPALENPLSNVSWFKTQKGLTTSTLILSPSGSQTDLIAVHGSVVELKVQHENNSNNNSDSTTATGSSNYRQYFNAMLEGTQNRAANIMDNITSFMSKKSANAADGKELEVKTSTAGDMEGLPVITKEDFVNSVNTHLQAITEAAATEPNKAAADLVALHKAMKEYIKDETNEDSNTMDEIGFILSEVRPQIVGATQAMTQADGFNAPEELQQIGKAYQNVMDKVEAVKASKNSIDSNATASEQQPAEQEQQLKQLEATIREYLGTPIITEHEAERIDSNSDRRNDINASPTGKVVGGNQKEIAVLTPNPHATGSSSSTDVTTISVNQQKQQIHTDTVSTSTSGNNGGNTVEPPQTENVITATMPTVISGDDTNVDKKKSDANQVGGDDDKGDKDKENTDV